MKVDYDSTKTNWAIVGGACIVAFMVSYAFGNLLLSLFIFILGIVAGRNL
jgi:biotin transporter BioY